MANEIAYSVTMNFAKSNAAASRASGIVNVTVSGSKYTTGVQNVGIVDETLALGDVGTAGVLMLHNVDTTNYVTVGADGSSYPIKLKPGEWALLRWNGAAIHALANTAACNLEYVLIED